MHWIRNRMVEQDASFPYCQWPEQALLPAGIDLLAITPQIAIRAVTLTPVHKDPFDRIIIASELEHQAQFASIDSLFSRYPELKSNLLSA